MIPLRDRNPSGTAPVVTIALIAVNVALFLVELGQGEQLKAFIEDFGLTPARITGQVDPPPQRPPPGWPSLRRTPYAVPAVATFFTSMFLHGGWMHLIGNMWFLWIFGDNVEDRMGHVKYLIFYLLCGLGAGVTQVVAEAGSPVPTIGASGAIAGVLGAYLVAFPGARVLTLVYLGIFITMVEVRAIFLLGFWFLIQSIGGMEALRFKSAGGVAFWAHIGGFVLGMLLLFAFQKPSHKRFSYQYLLR